MNKFIKKLLLAAAVMIPVGAVILVVGIAMGGKGFRMDSKFNIIESTEVYKYENMDLASFDKVDVDISNARIVIKESTDGKYGVKASLEDFGDDPVIEVRDNCLYIENNKSEAGFFNINFGSITKDLYVEVYLPQSDYNHFDIDTSNGAITIEDASVENVDLKTSNGKVKIENVICNKLVTKTSNGSITVANSEIADMELKTSNGKINADGSFTGNVNIKSSNGAIAFETKQSEDYYDIDMDTSNGTIKVAGDKKDDEYRKNNNSEYDLYIKTSNGSIEAWFNK